MQREPSSPSPPKPAGGRKRSTALGPYLLLLGVGLGSLALAATKELGRIKPFVMGWGVAMCLVVAVVLVRRRSKGRPG